MEQDQRQDRGASAEEADRAATPSGPSQEVSGKAGIPCAGDWLVIREWSLEIRQVAKVTPKLLKLGEGSSRWPAQLPIGDRRIVCSTADRETADRLRHSIAGIDGEYNKRRIAANDDCRARIEAAERTRKAAIAKLLAEQVPA